MKKLLCSLLFLFTISLVFSQVVLVSNVPVPNDIILSYQEEIELWLEQNNIQVKHKIKRFNDIELFITPYIHQSGPKVKIFGKGGDNIECFAVGKFLTTAEKEEIYTKAYSCIPQDAKQIFHPFNTFEYFKNSLIFNPNMLFAGNGNDGINSDFVGEFPYLIFYFGSNLEWYTDSVFDIQLNQLVDGNNKNYLIFPYSLEYALFRINDKNELELICYYGIN